jgi:hypothetical protein
MEPSHLRRHTDRASYDLRSVQSVFEDCFMAHVSYVDNGLPACLPMIALIKGEEELEVEKKTFSTEEYNEDTMKSSSVAVYLHGHPSSRLMELVRKASQEAEDKNNGNDPFETHSGPEEQVKVCITATKGKRFCTCS